MVIASLAACSVDNNTEQRQNCDRESGKQTDRHTDR